MGRSDAILPIRVFAIVLAVAFGVELAIMVFVGELEAPLRTRRLLSVVDALLLVIVLCPVLWFLVVRPLRATLAERGELLARTIGIQEDERARLARDLHDELGQCQTAILLAARSIRAAPTLDDAKARADEVARMASEAVDATRRLARGLGPGVLLDLGLAVAAERLCEDIAAASGIPIERVVRLDDADLSDERAITLFRVLQEALTNAVRHARPTRIGVELLRVRDGTRDELRLVVCDDGRGFSPTSLPTGAGFGLRGMRERIALQGGRMSVRSVPGQGTTVTATIPLPSERSPR